MSTPSAAALARRFARGYLPLLQARFQLEALEQHPWPVTAITREGEIVYVNPAWSRFAHDNGGGAAIDSHWSLGANYFAAITEPLRPFYLDLVTRAPTPNEALKPRAHEYECSSADTYRRFAVQIFALHDGRGHVLVNSLRVERPHEADSHAPSPPDFDRYNDANGLVRQCAHCRRVQRQVATPRWDWVPAWVTRPPRATTHTVCTLCYGYYYPGVQLPPEP